MEYFIQRASEKDLKSIMYLYARARKFMEATGNPNQWGMTYPDEETVRRDIARENLYTVRDSSGIHGVFYFARETEPTYEIISDGVWSSDRPYGVIHRVAGDGSGGILKAVIRYAAELTEYLRIDTHEDNFVMQNALRKQGFQKCGIILVEDGSPRIAYDRIDGIREAQYDDLEQLLNLYCHLHESSVPEDSDNLRSTWKQMLQDKDHHVIVYVSGGIIVSSCICVMIPNLTRNVRPYGFIENVVTHKAYRGRGYASACLTYAKEIAKRNKCYKLMLLTGSKEKATLDFYRNAGFDSSDKTAFVQWFDI